MERPRKLARLLIDVQPDLLFRFATFISSGCAAAMALSAAWAGRDSGDLTDAARVSAGMLSLVPMVRRTWQARSRTRMSPRPGT